jgi:predicted kinase
VDSAAGIREADAQPHSVLDDPANRVRRPVRLRQAAADIGAAVVICYFELTPTELRKRLDQRLAEAPPETWPISDQELTEWASNIDIPTSAELDGSEPVGDPPGAFATWREWAEHRWPPSVL